MVLVPDLPVMRNEASLIDAVRQAMNEHKGEFKRITWAKKAGWQTGQAISNFLAGGTIPIEKLHVLYDLCVKERWITSESHAEGASTASSAELTEREYLLLKFRGFVASLANRKVSDEQFHSEFFPFAEWYVDITRVERKNETPE